MVFVCFTQKVRNIKSKINKIKKAIDGVDELIHLCYITVKVEICLKNTFNGFMTQLASTFKGM